MISMMFEVYLRFFKPRDQYLVRLLASLLRNAADLLVIWSHFTRGMENEFIAEAMELCFQGIIDTGTNKIEEYH